MARALDVLVVTAADDVARPSTATKPCAFGAAATE